MNPQTPEERLAAYRKALAAHDWYFDYSDDQSAWRRGREQRAHLMAEARAIDPDYAIWKEYAPKQ